MGKLKNTALLDWMHNRGYMIGRKWATQRLPKGLIITIRQLASERGLSPAQIIEDAFRGNPDLQRDFFTHSRPWAGLVDLAGQQQLDLK